MMAKTDQRRKAAGETELIGRREEEEEQRRAKERKSDVDRKRKERPRHQLGYTM